MKRRSFLITITGIAIFAGCLEEDSDAQAAFNESFISTLDESHDIEIITGYWEDERYVVEHRTGHDSLAAIETDIGDVAGGLASIYDIYDVELDAVEGQVYSEDGDMIGTYVIEPTWAAQFASEEITETEYLDLIISTYESV